MLAYKDKAIEPMYEDENSLPMAKGQLKGDSQLRLRIIKGMGAFTNSFSPSKGIQKEINKKIKTYYLWLSYYIFQWQIQNF